MNSSNEKLKDLFGKLVVDKKLSQIHEVARLPRFIGEYLIASYCQDNPGEGIKKLRSFVDQHVPEPKDKHRIRHELMTNGEYELIDDLRVEAIIEEGTYNVIIPCLDIRDGRVTDSVLEANRNLLGSGIWGFATLKYRPDLFAERPVLLSEFLPFQAVDTNLNEFSQKRGEFTLDEWIDVLVNTLGLSPQAYTQKAKLILLSRLVPLVEENVNIIELGPRATGKTYLFRNISYHTRIFAGGKVSPAILFYHIPRKAIGDIGTRDCVVFDEIQRISFADPDEMMGKMKDYMVDGFFERGEKKLKSVCSLAFVGNIEVEGETPAEEFSEALPRFMRDSAFIDRIHGLIPGWELPKLMKAQKHLSQGFGLVTSYFCEILHLIRRKYFQHFVNDRAQLTGEVTFRDERGIKKLASGMLKILCPHEQITNEELEICMDLACEYRQRVADWLHLLSPGEFKKIRLGYRLKV